MTIEELAAEIEEMSNFIEGESGLGSLRGYGFLVIEFSTPRPGDQDHNGLPNESRDLWSAAIRGWRGTGATCEMALLELRESLRKTMAQAIEFEQNMVEERTARLAKMKARVSQ